MKVSNDIAKEWEKSLSPHSYQIENAQKEFFLSLQESKYLKVMLAYAKLPKNAKILEAGCGSGKFSVVLAVMGYEVTAMDYTDSILENTLKLKEQAEGFFGPIKLKVLKDDLRNLKTKERFDLVFNEGVVEHWLVKKERLSVLKEMKKVAKKGGTIAVFVPNGENPLHPWWVFSRFPGYLSAPPMTIYGTKKLKEELEQTGLNSVSTDGLDAYYFINKWPRLKILDYPLGFLEKNLTLPKPIREKLGLSIVGLGKNQ